MARRWVTVTRVRTEEQSLLDKRCLALGGATMATYLAFPPVRVSGQFDASYFPPIAHK